MNGHTTYASSSLPPPLRTMSDMPSTWRDVELDFDSAAEIVINAHKNDGAARDLPVVDLKTWAVAPHEGNFALVPLARHHEPKPLRSNAFANLMTRLGAPSDFVRKLPAPLQLAIANYLVGESTDSSAAMLRLRGDEVAAIVSSKYAPLDPIELVETVRDALVKHGMLHDVRVRAAASGLIDNLRLVFPSEERAIKPGDVSALGLDITSSSFARSAVHVSPVIWRLVCSNGLKRPERGGGFSFRHSGDPRRLRDAVTEAIPSAIVRARGVMSAWQRSIDVMVTDALRQVEEMRELTHSEREAIGVELHAGAKGLPEHIPLYDFVNAITASAKLAQPVRRLELEGMAGDLLTQHVGGPS